MSEDQQGETYIVFSNNNCIMILVRCFLSLISIFIIFTSSFSITVSRKISDNFRVEFCLKGRDFIMILFSLMGILGMVPTGLRGRCSRKLLGCKI